MVAEISRKYVRSSKLTKTTWSCDPPYVMQTAVKASLWHKCDTFVVLGWDVIVSQAQYNVTWQVLEEISKHTSYHNLGMSGNVVLILRKGRGGGKLFIKPKFNNRHLRNGEPRTDIQHVIRLTFEYFKLVILKLCIVRFWI